MLTLVYRDLKTNRQIELEGTALLLDGGLSLKAWWGEWRTFAIRPDVASPRWRLDTHPDLLEIDPINAFLAESEPLIVHARRQLEDSWQEWEALIDVQWGWDPLAGRPVLTRNGGEETLVHEPDGDYWFSPATLLHYEQVLLGARQTVADLVRGLSPLPPLQPLGPRLRLSPLAARVGV